MDVGHPVVLVADSDSRDRSALCTGLRELGYTILEAGDDKEALALMRRQPPDLLLLDPDKPGMNGFSLLSRMKADPVLQRIPAIVVSDRDDMGTVILSIAKGAADHLSLPVDPVFLHVLIRQALTGAGRQADPEKPRPAHLADTATVLAGAAAITEEGEEETGEEEEEGEDGMGMLAFGRSLRRWMWPYRRQIPFYLLIMVVSMGVEAALPMGLKFITDYALIPRNSRLLVLILTVFLAAAFCSTGLQILGDYIYSRIGNKLINDLRFNMYRHLQRLSIGYYKRVPAGEIMARFSTDLASVESTLILSLPNTLGQVIALCSTVLMLFILEWRLALFSLLGLFMSYKGGEWVAPLASSASYRTKRGQAKISTMVQENVQGQSVVKVFRLQSLFIERFKHQMMSFYSIAARASFLEYMTQRVSEQSIMLFNLLTICMGAVLAYNDVLSIGALVSFQVLLGGLTTAVGEVTWGIPHLIQASAGMQRIEELLDETQEVTDDPAAATLPPPAREVTLTGVSFGYKRGQLNIDNLTMTVPFNRNVLLVGPSGCGKSTVLNLLMRFYDVEQGRIAFDGTDIRTISQDSLRRYMSVVLQDNFLFNTSIRGNIRLGKPDATDAEVEAAARSAEIHHIIMEMPEGYDTMVGETGGNLSGGQRQRVAIARAIISDPALLLLDEATSALDQSTAMSINRSLTKIAEGRTVISVTHRLESASDVDIIFVLKDGRLEEHGPHGQLLRNNGTYARLWRKQGGFSLDPDGERAEVATARLRDIHVLAPLGDALLREMKLLLVTEHFGRDRIVVQEGDSGDRFYIIVRGRVAVTQRPVEGAEQSLAVLEDGDYFGEIALLRKIPRGATVRTLTDCVFLTLANEHFQRLVEANQGLRQSLEKVMQLRSEEHPDQMPSQGTT